MALSYDRVIEDRILIEAHAKGETRFRGNIPSAIAFIGRYVWRRITRRAQKFGTAGVSFGEPLALSDLDDPGDMPELARTLMGRIARVTPLLPVPLLAALLARTEGEVSRAVLLDEMTALITACEAAGAVVLGEEDGPEKTLDRALWLLQVRRIIEETGDGYRVVPEKRALVAYYAGSVAVVQDALAANLSLHAG